VTVPTVRVYVNEKGVDVPATARAIDAVRLVDGTAADGVQAGTRAVTDSRGLPIPADSPVHGGAIYRVVSGRAARDAT
jgi:hypothetical protein